MRLHFVQQHTVVACEQMLALAKLSPLGLAETESYANVPEAGKASHGDGSVRLAKADARAYYASHPRQDPKDPTKTLPSTWATADIFCTVWPVKAKSGAGVQVTADATLQG